MALTTAQTGGWPRHRGRASSSLLSTFVFLAARLGELDASMRRRLAGDAAVTEFGSLVGEVVEAVAFTTRFRLPLTAEPRGLLRVTARPAILLGAASQPM